ncbi:bestrophin-2 [Daphnia magna]|uniref:bestrophin-2 n=1 Tax=Daphnia magna TaxID=35525 RepID=UPI0006E023EB|nr:bestrophin-2 [Daphnia magna]XP_045036090.1 bestrophin-2 [Daphnia magna]
MNLKKTPGLDLKKSFLTLLFKWRGSLYKLCYRELVCFLVLFCAISLIYRQALDGDQKSFFEKIVRYCEKYLNMVPLSFILGFYVTTVATRWWQQCLALPWPDRIMLSIAMYIPGCDNESKLLRKTLLQYCNLMAVLVFRTISEAVKFRLNTLEDVVNAGFMTKAEMECFKAVKADCNLFWLPGLWFCHRLREAQVQGRVIDPFGAQLIMRELLEFRSRCGLLWVYDWVTIPLVYTQVVTLSTYSFVFACLIGRQNIDNGNKDIPIDVYFPVWTVLQILFYLGLLKVAENMIHPLGEDDEDFNLSFLLNRNVKVINVGTHAFTSDMCPPMEGDHLQTDQPGIHTPHTSHKTSHQLKNRIFKPKLPGLYTANKEKAELNNKKPEQTIPTISMGVLNASSYSLDLALLPGEPNYQGKAFSWNL